MRMRDEENEREALRQMIEEEAARCTDTDLLNLVYKMLAYGV